MVARMHLDLCVDLTDKAISGQVELAGGEPRGFVGYAGLIAALESIRREEIAHKHAADLEETG
jgi:hypothetical protein